MEFWRSLVSLLRILVQLYAILIVVRAFAAFFVYKQNNLTAFVYRASEPCLKFFRRVLPRRQTGFDWSYVLALVALTLIIFLLQSLLNSLK